MNFNNVGEAINGLRDRAEELMTLILLFRISAMSSEEDVFFMRQMPEQRATANLALRLITEVTSLINKVEYQVELLDTVKVSPEKGDRA